MLAAETSTRMTRSSQPLVSIGIPVYNGGQHIRQAVESLLAQSYANCQLQISDNASTDDTEEICRFYLTKDARVRYHRNPSNVGMKENWRRVLQLASGDYFMWAACDDYWSPNYIETLVECLQAHPRAILAAGKTLYVDAQGNPHTLDPDDAPVRHFNAHLATAKQVLQQHAHNWLHGLFPRETLLKVAPSFFAGNPWGADVVFLLQICLSDEVVGSDAAVMYKRVSGISGPKTPRQRVAWQCWFARALWQVIRRSSLSPSDKRELFNTYVLYLKWLYLRRGVVSFAKLWGKAIYQWSIGVDRP